MKNAFIAQLFVISFLQYTVTSLLSVHKYSH